MREDPDYNQRQYERMLARIDMYRKGEISFPTLVRDLEALIFSLENVDWDWRNTLVGPWGTLEVAYAEALDKAEQEFYAGRAESISWHLDAEAQRVIAETLDELERIIKNRGPESNSLVN
jgi:hypothetical protein